MLPMQPTNKWKDMQTMLHQQQQKKEEQDEQTTTSEASQ